MSKGIDHYSFNDKVHFKVEDVKQHMPDMKINTDLIIEKSEGGKRLMLVNEDALSEMTEFDKKVRQSLNFDPKR